VLVELSVMEQRYQAVMAVVQDGWKVTEVADRLGVSRQSVGTAADTATLRRPDEVNHHGVDKGRAPPGSRSNALRPRGRPRRDGAELR